jgi:hypothetical protein
MNFLVYQVKKDPEYFIITDDAHRAQAYETLGVQGGDLEPVGSFGKMGKERVAFDEAAAIASIKKKGYYQTHAEHLADVPIAPEMPG